MRADGENSPSFKKNENNRDPNNFKKLLFFFLLFQQKLVFSISIHVFVDFVLTHFAKVCIINIIYCIQCFELTEKKSLPITIALNSNVE